jgi:hypothetical protein
MTGTKQSLLDVVEIDLGTAEDNLRVYANVYDNSLSRKWLAALNDLLKNNYHLEKITVFLVLLTVPGMALTCLIK